jgi:arsenical pump membrane protein
MTGEVVALASLAAPLAFAVVRPRGLPEAAAAVPAALLVVASGGLAGPGPDLASIRRLRPIRRPRPAASARG